MTVFFQQNNSIYYNIDEEIFTPLFIIIYGSRYSRMDQVKFMENSL